MLETDTCFLKFILKPFIFNFYFLLDNNEKAKIIVQVRRKEKVTTHIMLLEL